LKDGKELVLLSVSKTAPPFSAKIFAATNYEAFGPKYYDSKNNDFQQCKNR